MNFINKLERKFGKYGIPNLTTYIVVCFAVGYVLDLVQPAILQYLSLEPGLILRGQIWRLFTWVLLPQGSRNILFAVIAMLFYYSIGNALERAWGTFRYTLFIFSGLLFTVLGAFLLYFITKDFIFTEAGIWTVGSCFSTYYISLSIFLAFAMSYPNMQVLLYFVIPIKVKWMAYLDIAILLYDVFTYLRIGLWQMVVPIAASLLNVAIFFFLTRDFGYIKPKEIKRRQEFRRAVSAGRAGTRGVTKHKCAVCGRTEDDGDDLEFRFCSKCNGNYEYCQDHLFTHEHIK